MNIVTWIVIANWALPLLLWMYPLVMILGFKDFEFKGFKGPFAKFKLANKGVESWHALIWRDWCGVGLYGFLCYRDEESHIDDQWVQKTVVHESIHCWQWLFMGLMFYISYMGHMVLIFIFQKNKHPYLDCWAERMARRKAGQQVNYTPNDWPQGPKDRWPW